MAEGREPLPWELEFLTPLTDLVVALGDVDVAGRSGMRVTDVTIGTPFELDVATSDEAPRLAASPPTQQIETSIMPVWHQLTVHLAVAEAPDEPEESSGA